MKLYISLFVYLNKVNPSAPHAVFLSFLYLCRKKVIVKRKTCLLTCLLVACTAMAQQEHIYALLLSGGRNKLYNHERYWNDCAFVYSTLRHDYRIPKENITLLMADGDNPERDVLLNGGMGFASTATDLDGDGVQELTLAATLGNLKETVHRLSERLTASDHLFMFITDHGELTAKGDVRLWLWGGETITAHELALQLSVLRPATMNLLLGQCYAGAFADCLRGDGRIVTSACGAAELSWACPDRAYDEFVYHWTCAVARHDENGQSVDADENRDGHVTMDEAFHYASAHDRRPETPELMVTPLQLAARWSFDGVFSGDGISTMPCAQTTEEARFDLLGRRVGRQRHGVIRILQKKKAKKKMIQ